MVFGIIIGFVAATLIFGKGSVVLTYIINLFKKSTTTTTTDQNG